MASFWQVTAILSAHRYLVLLYTRVTICCILPPIADRCVIIHNNLEGADVDVMSEGMRVGIIFWRDALEILPYEITKSILERCPQCEETFTP